MQSDPKQIYKLTAERTGKSEQAYKDLGNFVFNNLYKELRRPKSLIIKLKGVGNWYLRKSRIEAIVNKFPPNFDKKLEEYKHRLDIVKHENEVDIYFNFKQRLKEYEEYIQLRNEVRKQRNETEGLLESPNRED